MSSEIITFSEEQQAAVLGHALQTKALWDRLKSISFSKEWLVNPRCVAIYEEGVNYEAKYKRPPGPSELTEYIKNKEEPAVATSRKKVVDWCVEASKNHGIDVLEAKLTDWGKSRLLLNSAKAVEAKYNEGDHDAAYKIIDQTSLQLRKLDLASGQAHDALKTAPTRYMEEEAARLKDRSNILQYGVSFFDDTLRGISPNDLILIGARSGGGKTELAKIIAMHNARQGKRVAFFALEAEEFEIERRMKFNTLAKLWRAANPGAPRGIANYADWRFCELQPMFAPYEDEAEATFKKGYETLKTYYRCRDDFGLTELEQNILEVYKNTDLFVLDHLHYLDLGDGENENRSMKNFMQKLRFLTTSLHKPVIAIAHLKKGASANVVPEMDDYMGSSDISKICTTAIMLAPAHGIVATNEAATGNGTFMRIVKFRLDGSRTYNVGLGFFDNETGTYKPDYALGRLNYAETKWTCLKEGYPPWAKNGTLRDIKAD